MAHERRYDLVIFDLDGTLADTGADIAAAMARVLRARGMPCPPAEVIVGAVGWGAGVLIERTIAPQHRDRADEVLAAFREDYRAHIADRSALYPGVDALLDALRGAGVRCAIATNKPRELTDALVDALGLTARIDDVIGPDDVPHRKPAPDALREAIRRAAEAGDGDAPRAVMVGDMETDVDAARAAGIPSILLTFSDFHRPPELAARADHTVAAFDALWPLLLG